MFLYFSLLGAVKGRYAIVIGKKKAGEYISVCAVYLSTHYHSLPSCPFTTTTYLLIYLEFPLTHFLLPYVCTRIRTGETSGQIGWVARAAGLHVLDLGLGLGRYIGETPLPF
jgi:hypothetical protein